MVDVAEVGKYGTIRLLKRREPGAVIASYPIDDEQVTFGRDLDCSVRLYYQSVNSLHCKIIFEERKAFLQVFGASGVIVDGCEVYPARSPLSASAPATVPLINGTIFEIHKKRFLFNYPPKELRPQLFTPASAARRRKSLRMSMIQSAHVFSPAPSSNPRDNLRVLQSPLKLTISKEDVAVTLVDGNHPRVLEEDQDLVIFEDVDSPPANAAVEPDVSTQTTPSKAQAQPRTPRRRSAPSLHRAVLIRSAQRVAYMREAQVQRQRLGYGNQFEEVNLDEDAAEEEEVEEVVNSNVIISDESEEDMTDVNADNDGYGNMILDGLENPEFENVEENEQDITEAHDEDDYDEDEETPKQYSTPLQVSRTLGLGPFMTPQPALFARRAVKAEGESEMHRTGPQRPPPGYRFSLAPGLGAGTISLRTEEKAEEKEEDKNFTSVRATSPTKSRPEVSEEERKAILERRRSALKAPDPEFADHVPGLGARRTSVLPAPGPLPPPSPFKSIREDIEEGEDTHDVLKRMEASLAGMRRKSMAGALTGLDRPNFGTEKVTRPPSPEKGFSLLAPGMNPSPMRGIPERRLLRFDEAGIVEETSSQLKKEEDLDPGDIHAALIDESDDEEIEHNENTRLPSHPPLPVTPRMNGLREMFRTPHAPALATPAVRGVRELFRENRVASALQTPRLDGVRRLFAERRVPATPAFDGIEEMMHLEVEDETVPTDVTKEDEEENAQDAHVDASEDMNDGLGVRQARARKASPQPIARGKMSYPVRGTPTDMSTMADDEATPDTVDTGPASKRRTAARGAPDAAIVHRTTRVSKAASAGSDAEEAVKKGTPILQDEKTMERVDDDAAVEMEKPLKATARRGRPSKAKPAATDSEVDNSSVAGTSADVSVPKMKAKGRPRKLDSTAIKPKVGPAVKSVRKGTRAAQTNSEDEAPAPAQIKASAVRRGTRARSRSVDPEGEMDKSTPPSLSSTDHDPLDSIERSPSEGPSSTTSKTKRGARGKAITPIEVETIPEEEEASIPTARAVLPLRNTAAARTRKTRAMDTEDSHDEDDAPPKKGAVGRRGVKASAASATVDDEDAATLREDKENTPDKNTGSPSESSEDVPAKATRTRVASKTATAATATKTKTAPASRSAKPTSSSRATKARVKVEEEPAIVPRTMRTRAKK
ncbi:hypothetical protein DFH11DRAFT_1604182 [Phellopilus nigrolimitatus]|nr:hypothetical protein DFH11DRAFT_1604182 [Phellopilus nigrolimitatus]